MVNITWLRILEFELVLIFLLNLIITFTDCLYTYFGPKVVANKEGATIKVKTIFDLDECKSACTEHPKCHSFQYCPAARKCVLKTRVLQESVDTKHHFDCASYYKPCGKYSIFHKYIYYNRIIFSIYTPIYNLHFIYLNIIY